MGAQLQGMTARSHSYAGAARSLWRWPISYQNADDRWCFSPSAVFRPSWLRATRITGFVSASSELSPACSRGGLPRHCIYWLAGAADTLGASPRFEGADVIAANYRGIPGGDNHLLSGVSRIVESQGFHLLGAHEVAPEILVPVGALGRINAAEQNREDIAFGFDYLRASGAFDVGQAVVVAGKRVLAVEAAEGTDQMLARVAELRSAGRIGAPPGVGVLVKAPKPEQDRRFDLPSIGPKTVSGTTHAKLAGIAVVAGATVIAEPERVVVEADRAGIFDCRDSRRNRTMSPRIFLVAGEELRRSTRCRADRCNKAAHTRIRAVFLCGRSSHGDRRSTKPFPLGDLAVIGFSGILTGLPMILRRIRETADAVISAKPDVLVIIDSPEFTHRVARAVRARAPEIPVVDYVCPSVWAWRPGRARGMRTYIDHVLALLPFEPKILGELGDRPALMSAIH